MPDSDDIVNKVRKNPNFGGMQGDELFMLRCIQLAQNGLGHVSTNPLVGCVIVHEGRIIGEGYHQRFGEAHAEVNALDSISDRSLIKESTVYVNLEPCSHHGKTPPCADRLIAEKVKRVVIGISDPFPEVAGRGIRKLKDAGIEVSVGVLENECRELNRRFLTYHKHRRPYVIIKWAQSLDGKIGSGNHEHWQISGHTARVLSHRWRTEEDGIMVGANTAIFDNPSLTARHWPGRNPVRVLLDPSLRVPSDFRVFDHSSSTIVMNRSTEKKESSTQWMQIGEEPFIAESIYRLFDLGVQSLIVEGGAFVHQTLIDLRLWDEARIFISNELKGSGTVAAGIPKGDLVSDSAIGDDQLLIIRNTRY